MKEVKSWYRVQKLRGDTYSEVQDLTPGMLGASEAPDCGLKGAETNSFVIFLKDLIQQRARKLPKRDVYIRLRTCFF